MSWLHLIAEEGNDAPASGRGMAGARGQSIFNILYFSEEPQPIKAIFSGGGKTKKDFLCATPCDMKMDG